MKRKVLIVSIVTILSLIFTSVAHAESEKLEEDNSISVLSLSDAEVDKTLSETIDSEVSNIISSYNCEMGNSVLRSQHGGSQWKTEYGPVKYAWVRGYAGNQVPSGYRFKTGGGFWFSDSGGPVSSVSVSFSAPFGLVGVSINLGKNATSGLFVNAPDKIHHFKLYISKQMRVRPFIVYNLKNGKWVIYHKGSAQAVQKIDLEAKIVS